jgi:hypothetical protein
MTDVDGSVSEIRLGVLPFRGKSKKKIVLILSGFQRTIIS